MREPTQHEIIGAGRTADILRRDAETVLKLYKPDVPDALVDVEATACRLARAVGLPVPAAGGRVEAQGRRGLVLEHVAGDSMLARFGRRPWGLLIALRRMAHLQAAMHRQPGDGLPAQHEFLERHIRAARLPAHLEAAALRALARRQAGDRLCHGDFHPGNVLWTPKGPVVIDWLTAVRGDAAADVARTLLLLEIGTLPPGMAFAAPLRRLAARIYLRSYVRAAAVTPAQVAAWRLPVLAARLGGDNAAERPRLLPLIEKAAR